MSSVSTLGIATELVQPVAPSPVGPSQPGSDIPQLEPVPMGTALALVPLAQQSPAPWWKIWDRGPSALKASDEPYWPDAQRAATQLVNLRNQIDDLHANLTSDTWIAAHRQASDMFHVAEARRASVLASLSGLKLRLDAGAAAGARAAISGYSRAEFARIALELRAMDAERVPLEKRATERHAEVKAATEQMAKDQAAAMEARSKEKEANDLRAQQKLDELLALTPEENEHLTTRIADARAMGFGFARYAHTSPEWKGNSDHEALPTNMVLVTLRLRHSVDFNELFSHTPHLKFAGWQRITSRDELERVLDSVLGQDPKKRRE